MVDITSVFNNYLQYVWGDVTLASIGFLIILTLIGMRFNWGMEAFTVVLTPTLLVLLDSFLPLGVQPLYLMSIGFIIGIGILTLIRR